MKKICVILLMSCLSFSGVPTAAFAEVDQSQDPIHTKLITFGHSLIDSMNNNVLPCHKKREVAKQVDGTYKARYINVDKQSLRASYKKPESPNKSVTYIGYLDYVETEMHCLGKTHKEASTTNDCTAGGRSDLTELVKYTKGKWTY